MRITSKMMTDQAINLIGKNYQRLAEIQSEVSSQKRVQNPHDDPIAAGRVLNLKSTLSANETYLQNISASSEWLDATEAALSAVSDIIRRGISDAQQGASDTIGDSERAGLAGHVDGLIEDALTQFNTRHREVYIFGGFRINTQPLTTTGTPITAVTYNGDNGQRLIEIEPGQTVAVNVNSLNGNSFTSAVFDPLIALRDALTANDTDAISASITTLQGALDNVQNTITALGARQQRLTDVRTRLEKVQIGLREFVSQTEDSNLADALLRLSQQDTVYQASLQASARLNQTNLFSYLR